LTALEIAREIVRILEEKKGENILLMDIREQAIFADYFVICSGTSDRMLNALLEAVRDGIREKFGRKARMEGESREGWVLADYGDVIVHAFSPDRRGYYRLEDLWSQSKILIRLQ